MFWFPIILLIALGTRGGDCDRVQFFGKGNYEYFLKEFDITGAAGNGCHNFQGSSSYLNVQSLKTDKCIILYSINGCNKLYTSYSIRVETGTSNLPDIEHLGRKLNYPQRIESFSVCSRELGGGPEVDVDFYGERDYEGKISAQYRDVCGCRNLEKSAVGGKSKMISVKNHGNSIDVFEGEHCFGQMRTLDAGVSYMSKYLWRGNDGKAVFDVQSFRPTNYERCIKLDASIYKFQFKNGTQKMIEDSKEENVALAADANFRNNGATSILQEYLVSDKITEGLEYTVATGFSNMDTYKADVKLTTEVQTGVPLLADGKVKVEVAAGYQKQTGETGSTTNKTNIVHEKLVTVRQQINIPPCKVCVASSFIKKVRNFPIAYTAFSRVTGMAGGQKMDAREIRSALRPEAIYLRDVDAYTVDVKVEGVMFADYGMNSFVNVDCTKIPECAANAPGEKEKSDAIKMQYIVPINKSR